MSTSSSFEKIFEKAKARAKDYCWVEAADLYAQSLSMIAEGDFLKLGIVQEEIGHCLYWASMQVESREEFEERTQQAIVAYKKAQEFYESLSNKQRLGRILRCESVCKYLESWLPSSQPQVNKLLTDCMEMAGKSLAIFLESGDMLQYGATYNALSLFPLTAFFRKIMYERDRQVMKKVAEDGLQWGKKALEVFHEQGDKRQIATAYCTWITCQLLFEWFFIEDPEEQDAHNLEVMGHLGKMLELSQEIGDRYLTGLTHFWLGDNTGGEESIKHLKKTIEAGKKTRDKALEACGIDFMANRTYWKAMVEENPDERTKLAEEAMRFYDEAQNYLSIVHFETPRGGLICPPGGHAEHYFHLAEWETNLGRKKELLDRAEKTGIQSLKDAEDFYYPNVVAFMLNMLSRIIEARSCLEVDLNEKRSLLERAIKYEERAIQNSGWKPYVYWNVGLMHNFLADLKAELGYLERAPENRRRLLEEAAQSKEECLSLIAKQEAPYYQVKGIRVPFIGLYRYQDTYGTLLQNLYELTGNPEHLRKAIEVSKKALEWHAKLKAISLVAESRWKIARTQDLLGEHLEAAENFNNAARDYAKAAKKIPQMNTLYQDHASYMLAWCEIEKARQCHAEEQYGMATTHYEKAAELHQLTTRWNYLTQNYLAWAQLEQAEELSRREKTEEAKSLFKHAADLFEEARISIQTKLEKSESFEKELLLALTQASDIRQEYCRGRIELEEAKILDRQGNHAASSAKYGSAHRRFQKIMTEAKDETSRRELAPIVCLSKAWQALTNAEAETSPNLYLEASHLFDSAKEQSSGEKARLLALGHSYFCKALEAGTRFEVTREPAVYSEAKKHVEAATNYYLKAGFKTASEYAKATYRLFDAYLYMYKAQTETDPEKKARFYEMVQKLLEASVDSYSKAMHPEKSEQVQRILERIVEEQQLAMSLTEVLHAPTIVSTTASFFTPTPTREKAVGLERFEHADVQASIAASQEWLTIGENLDLDIELVNAGQGSASLVKLADVAPEGFELIQKPDTYNAEDNYLNMKGKRLDPLKTEEIRLVLKPKVQGEFSLKPRVLYLDENGRYKSCGPDAVTITVESRLSAKVAEKAPQDVLPWQTSLDRLLYGGIPDNFAVVLTAPACDERESLIKEYLEKGVGNDEATVYITANPDHARSLVGAFGSNLYILICNPHADLVIDYLPNIVKLNGVENLTNISIALTSAIRKIGPPSKGHRRFCVDLVSDVLLQHHAVQTRRWLAALITELKSAGFTSLAVMDPRIHPSEELYAILGLFDGEINVYEKETEKGSEKYLKIKRMSNQKYLGNELLLKKEG